MSVARRRASISRRRSVHSCAWAAVSSSSSIRSTSARSAPSSSHRGRMLPGVGRAGCPHTARADGAAGPALGSARPPRRSRCP
jgi:hypothetical protein